MGSGVRIFNFGLDVSLSFLNGLRLSLQVLLGFLIHLFQLFGVGSFVLRHCLLGILFVFFALDNDPTGFSPMIDLAVQGKHSRPCIELGEIGLAVLILLLDLLFQIVGFLQAVVAGRI